MRKLPLMSKLGVVFLTWRRLLQKDMVKHRITLKQHFVLLQLSKNEFLYPSQIAEMLFCDRPTATVVINNMEREKWIRRQKDPKNGKQTLVSITDEGRTKLKLVESDIRSEGTHSLDPLQCLTDSEKKQLEYLLDKLGDYLESL